MPVWHVCYTRPPKMTARLPANGSHKNDRPRRSRDSSGSRALSLNLDKRGQYRPPLTGGQPTTTQTAAHAKPGCTASSCCAHTRLELLLLRSQASEMNGSHKSGELCSRFHPRAALSPSLISQYSSLSPSSSRSISRANYRILPRKRENGQKISRLLAR